MVGTRFEPRGRWRAWLVVAVLLALTVGSVPPAPAGAAAPGQPGHVVRYQGILTFGSVPATAGTLIMVVSARSATDVTVCGFGTVEDNLGTYAVDVLPVPGECVKRTRSDTTPQYIFLVRGENVAVQSENGISLDRPATLGQVRRLGLRASAVPALDAVDWTSGGQDAPVLMAARYYGIVRLGTVPAPAGTEIRVVTYPTAAGPVVCGTGVVVDDLGSYSVDIQPTPGECLARTRGETNPQYHFIVNDQNVTQQSLNNLSVDRPTTLAKTHKLDLRVAASAAPARPAVPGS